MDTKHIETPGNKDNTVKITEITVDPACNGPLQYRIKWQCRACKQVNLLQKKASLLPEETVICRSCGQHDRYVFKALLRDSHAEQLEALFNIEQIHFRELSNDLDNRISLLGHNFVFAVSAYLSNIRRSRHG